VFSVTDFAIFNDQTLAGRLGKIQTILDPKFETLSALLLPKIQQTTMPTQYFHVAKHLRRHKNPPVDTWMALSANKRGYKMGPHIEVGFWDDRLFVWAALLIETKAAGYRPHFEQWTPLVDQLQGDWQVAGNHMKKEAEPLSLASYARISHRYTTVKAGEWLIGKTYLKDDPIFATPERLWQDIQARVVALAPLYAAMQA